MEQTEDKKTETVIMENEELKRVKDVSFETDLFIASAKDIQIVRADSIVKVGDGKIRIEAYYMKYYGDADDTMFKSADGYGKVFLNLSEAQERQSEMRRNAVETAFDEMNLAQEKYNTLIKQYFNKPLSNPFKKNN